MEGGWLEAVEDGGGGSAGRLEGVTIATFPREYCTALKYS